MITDLNTEKYDVRLMENVKRRIELKVVQNELIVRNELLKLKKKELKERREELDNINSELWNTQGRYCDEIWNFSSRHNFNKFFNQYPDGTQIIDEPHKCKYNSVIDEGAGKTDTRLKLKQEIDIINNELTLVRNNNIGDELERCRVTLNNLVSFSEEVLKLIRSISAISDADSSLSISNLKENEEPHRDKGFTSARTLLAKENGFRNCVVTGSNYKSTSANLNGEIERRFNIRNTIVKYRTFVMKSQSTVGLKYEKKEIRNGE